MIINKRGRTFTAAYEIPQETHQNYWTKQKIQQDHKIGTKWEAARKVQEKQAMGKENAVGFFCMYTYKSLTLKIVCLPFLP